VVESNGQDVHVPWFSGICLEGVVAGQYEMDLGSSPQEPEKTGVAGALALDGLGPITIFVGANNSGKSRLMRELFKAQQPLSIKLKSRDNEGTEVDIGEEIPKWIRTKRGILNKNIINGWIVEEDRSQLGAYIKSLDDDIFNSYRPGERQDLIKLKQKISGCGIEGEIRCLKQTRRFYIPILRGMRPPLIVTTKEEDYQKYTDIYVQRTLHDYFNKDIVSARHPLDEELPNLIFTGLTLYANLRRRLLARTQAERKTVRDYELFLSEYFFPGQSVTMIPVEEGENDVVHIRIGDNDERPIYDLGDGMQSLIICTYPIVTETEPGSLFFLEEPDLCMHPSLQRTFLEVLKTYHRKMGHQFFITTHSNHLLDLLEDNELVSIFSFSEIADQAPTPAELSQADSAGSSQSSNPKQSRFRIRPSILGDRQTLLELGVRPSATYLANATIWVEGVSDSAYLRAYMEAFVHYLKHLGKGWGKALAERLEQYKEDRHYAFVEYSGANLTHFSFEESERDNGQTETSVRDLCGKAIVIADGDIVAKVNREAHFEAQLKERFICLPCKEIENLIPEVLMKKQIRLDHTPPQKGHVDEGTIENINYASYARSGEGIGKYLGDLGMSKYSGTTGNGGGSGTLPTTYKSRWRSVEKGIPALIRNQIDVVKDPINSTESIQADDLPDYLTQDLIWLCILLYIHIAGCNYDKNTENLLKELQGHIENQVTKSELDPVGEQVHDLALNFVNNSMAETTDQAKNIPNPWPIPIPKDNTSSRSCLLKNFSPSVSQS
jgi:hypothetical protein